MPRSRCPWFRSHGPRLSALAGVLALTVMAVVPAGAAPESPPVDAANQVFSHQLEKVTTPEGTMVVAKLTSITNRTLKHVSAIVLAAATGETRKFQVVAVLAPNASCTVAPLAPGDTVTVAAENAPRYRFKVPETF